MPLDGLKIAQDTRARDLAMQHRLTTEYLLRLIPREDFKMQHWEECIVGQLAKHQIDGWYFLYGTNPRRTRSSIRETGEDFADYIGVDLSTASDMLMQATYYDRDLKDVTIEDVIAKLRSEPIKKTAGLCREARSLHWRQLGLQVTMTGMTLTENPASRLLSLFKRIRRWFLTVVPVSG